MGEKKAGQSKQREVYEDGHSQDAVNHAVHREGGREGRLGRAVKGNLGGPPIPCSGIRKLLASQ